ncbi:MAG: EI24 domain-containing protein [Campylobacterales bacterium]|nr:EI24 domain-containing protein [Campylobacterales bacterium]
MNEENTILGLSIKDLFTGKMLKYSLLPFFLSLLILYVLFFVVAGIGLDSLGSMHVQTEQVSYVDGIEHTDSFQAQLEGSAMIQFLMSHALTSWIATFLVYTIGTFLTLYFSIFVALIIIGFMTPFILKEIQARHYNDIEMQGYSNIFEGIFLTLKWAFLMLLMFVLLFPLYFIPVINIVAFNLPLYYFFHKMLIYDISSNISTRDEAMKIKFFHAKTLRLKTVALYLLSLIPFVIFFASVFYVIYLGHSYFIETRKLRTEV